MRRTPPGYLAILLLALVFAACGGGEERDADTVDGPDDAVVDSLIEGSADDTVGGPVHEPPVTGEGAPGVRGFDGAEGEGADPLTGRTGEDGSGADAGRSGPDQDGTAGQTPRGGDDRDDGVAGGDRSDQGDGGDISQLAASYQLASVEGQDLPVTIGEGPECDLQLVNGQMRIDERRGFEIRTTVHHVCGGEHAGEEVHTAEGTVQLAGGQLRFDAQYESIFATAYGRRMADGAILINRLETEGESHAVQWRFLR